MKAEKTNRGFDIIRFTDRNGDKCSIQKSSIATEDCIWLGSEQGIRMHLNTAQVAQLLSTLELFIKTGEIT